MRIGDGPRLRLLLAVALAALPGWVRAQPVEMRLTTADGLPSRYIKALAQDHEGFLWIGTADGLARYDGNRLRVYRQSEAPGSLSSSFIHKLHVGESGTLWVITVEGVLHRFDRRTETFTTVTLPGLDPGHAPGTGIEAFLEAHDGALWVLTRQGERSTLPGLYRYDPQANTTTPYRDVAPTNVDGTDGLHEDPQGHLWIRIRSRVGRAHLDGRVTWYSPYRDSNLAPSAFLQQGDTLLVVSSGSSAHPGGLARYDAAQDRFVALDLSWPDVIRAAVQTGNDAWMVTDAGLHRVSLRDPPRHLPPPVWSAGRIERLYADRDGLLWIANQGLARLNPQESPFRTLGPDDGLGRPSVNAILTAPDSVLWIGANDGLHRLDRRTDRLDHFTLPHDYAHYSGRVWTLLRDRDGTLLVGAADQGLYRFHQGRFEAVALPEFPSQRAVVGSHRIRHLYLEPDGTLWVGTSKGLLRRDPSSGRFVAFGPEPGRPAALPDPKVNVIRRDRQGRLWVGTDRGLVHWDSARGRVLAHYQVGDGLRNDFVWAIHEDAEGVLWIGTVGGGLHRFDPDTGRLRVFTTADGLPHDAVHGILPEPGTNALWLSTGRGLARFDPSASAGQAPATGSVESYTAADGLASEDFNLMAYHAAGDELFFGSAGGLAYFRPAEVRVDARPAPLAFTGLRIYDRDRPGLLAHGDTLRLAPDESFFSVAFTAIDFTPGRHHRYRYRLDGYDDRWRQTDDARPEAAYTDVPPGRYHLTVWSLDRAGRPTSEASLAVFVAPAWWEQGLVRGLGLLLALALAFGTGGWLQRQRNRRAEAARARARETTLRLAASREAERQHLARELHDGPLQDLYGLGHRLDDLVERDGQAGEIGEARRTVTRVADELRGVCAALRPPVLVHFGPAAALRAHAERLGRRPDAPHLSFEATVEGRQLSPMAQLALFRIGQEALNNAVHHAAATHVQARMEPEAEGVRLVVEDDGHGFRRPASWGAYVEAEHFGLAGAAERAEAMGGRLRVESAPGKGTRVEAWLPLAASSDDPLSHGEGDAAPGD